MTISCISILFEHSLFLHQSNTVPIVCQFPTTSVSQLMCLPVAIPVSFCLSHHCSYYDIVNNENEDPSLCSMKNHLGILIIIILNIYTNLNGRSFIMFFNNFFAKIVNLRVLCTLKLLLDSLGSFFLVGMRCVLSLYLTGYVKYTDE